MDRFRSLLRADALQRAAKAIGGKRRGARQEVLLTNETVDDALRSYVASTTTFCHQFGRHLVLAFALDVCNLSIEVRGGKEKHLPRNQNLFTLLLKIRVFDSSGSKGRFKYRSFYQCFLRINTKNTPYDVIIDLCRINAVDCNPHIIGSTCFWFLEISIAQSKYHKSMILTIPGSTNGSIPRQGGSRIRNDSDLEIFHGSLSFCFFLAFYNNP